MGEELDGGRTRQVAEPLGDDRRALGPDRARALHHEEALPDVVEEQAHLRVATLERVGAGGDEPVEPRVLFLRRLLVLAHHVLQAKHHRVEGAHELTDLVLRRVADELFVELPVGDPSRDRGEVTDASGEGAAEREGDDEGDH